MHPRVMPPVLPNVLAEMPTLEAEGNMERLMFSQDVAGNVDPANTASSFAQISENPDDGFAKVEAKLKALQEKIKADTAKFEQEAKAAPSSLLQQFENPDDGFAKVEAKLKALQEKIKADTAKFEQEAKAAPSSLIQESPDDGFAKVE